MEIKKTKKLVLKKSVIKKLNDNEMDYVWGGRCSDTTTQYSPCQNTPTNKCQPG